MEQGKEKRKSSTLAIIVLIILVIGLSGYIFYDKFLPKNHKQDIINTKATGSKINSKVNSTKTYNADNYVSVTDFEFNKNCTDCGTYGVVKKVEFKNLELRTITEFNSKHTKFISSAANETAKLSNEIIYETDKNIFSIFEKDKKTYEKAEVGSGQQFDYYSLNINLDNQKIITNEELLKIYNIRPIDMYKKILTNIANTVSIDQFLLDTDGNVAAKTLKVSDFKKNVSTYANEIDNRFDVIYLYLNNNKVYVVYEQSKILEILGMGCHMNLGLVEEPQIIKIN